MSDIGEHRFSGTTSYFLGRPWQNSTGASPVAENKVVFLNTVQSGAIVLAAGWSTWDAGTNTALITNAEYQSVNGIAITCFPIQ